MSRQRATIIKGPWSKSRVLSPLEVYIASQNYWTKITATRKSLLSTRRVVLSNTTIRPSQCDCIVRSLREAILPIRNFYNFLDKQEHGICSSRYPVLYALIDSEALLEDLIEHIIALREHCWISSHQTAAALLGIQHKFDALLQNWKIMQKRTTGFLDRMSIFLDVGNKPARQSQTNILRFHCRSHLTGKSARSFASSPCSKASLQKGEVFVEL